MLVQEKQTDMPQHLVLCTGQFFFLFFFCVCVLF